ncbi:outer membrane beta-barrel family protein [Pedobacter miscanthi]|uniref:outer membrane beta-barrel family protein n=1 Tax=Pedobacter miscanthi TaxID=2259170 RepID=UPI0029317E65|nr:outer membrane beta-barrel family protein [Pedobacter miscanthi]
MYKFISLASGKKPDVSKLLPYIFLLLLCFLTSNKVFAQSDPAINGTVVMENGSPVEFASVALQNEEGKGIKGTLTDSLGRFSFPALQHGKYRIKISNMGYITHHTNIIQLTAQRSMVILGKLKLMEDAQTLNSVNISVQKKVIEQSIDKMTINVENSILSAGNTALELLQRAPGIKVDDEGKISLKGRTGVNVMINGKLTYLSPAELAVLLKGTNSASVSKIEIMANPSAKYDAAGNAGIINIVMKKSQMKGLNGSVSINGGAGRKARYGSGFSLNYKNAGVNVFGSYNYTYRGETEYLDFSRRFYTNGIVTGNYDRISNQHTETNEPLNTNNFRAGMDVDIDQKNTLGFLINGNIGKYLHDSKTSNILQNQSGVIQSEMATTNYDQQNWSNITYNLNYLRKFKKEARTLSADVDFAGNSFTSKLNLDTYTAPNASTPAKTSNRKGYVPAKTDVYVAKVDYSDQPGKAIKIDGGIKSAFINADNNLLYQNLADGAWVYDPSSSNYFKYEEQIHAAYLNLNREFKTFTVQLGLRGEYTHTLGNQVTTGAVLKRNYFQLFPNVALNKTAGENNQFQLAYSRRIQRPDYGDLNPFRVFRDPLLYYEGNPYLTPELTQNIVLSHVFKAKYTTALNYSRTTGVITWVTGQIDTLNTTYERPQNLKSLVNYGISFTGQTNYFNWWTATNFANIYNHVYRGGDESGAFKNSQVSFTINTQNSFKLGSGYSAELNAYFNSKSVYGISTEKAYHSVSAAFQKNLFKDKANLKMLVNDIFQSSQYKQFTRYQNIDMNSHVNVDGRRVMLSFSYRFGNTFNIKERKNGDDDIQNRIKGGG